MSKIYYRLNNLCMFLKQEKIIESFDILDLKSSNDDDKIFEEYKEYYKKLLQNSFNDQLNVSFIYKYKSFIDEYEDNLKKLKDR
jgi:hypothetical protein